jgi:hypothetical protein
VYTFFGTLCMYIHEVLISNLSCLNYPKRHFSRLSSVTPRMQNVSRLSSRPLHKIILALHLKLPSLCIRIGVVQQRIRQPRRYVFYHLGIRFLRVLFSCACMSNPSGKSECCFKCFIYLTLFSLAHNFCAEF